MRGELAADHPADVHLGGAVGRTVVVREVEMDHAPVERAEQDVALPLGRTVVAEVLPEPQGEQGQLEPDRPERRYVIWS